MGDGYGGFGCLDESEMGSFLLLAWWWWWKVNDRSLIFSAFGAALSH